MRRIESAHALWRCVAACWLALACGPATVSAFAAAGRIDALDGPVSVVTRGAERAAKPDTDIEEGDTIKTGRDAWALIELADGASLTLRPDTTLRITTYRYTGADDGSEKSVLSLLKGALRSITGAIGRHNPGNYSITTPTATIGVRGTDHEPAYYPPAARNEKLEHEPGTYDKVNDGETFLRTPKGEVRLKPGQYGFAHHDLRRPPRLLAKPPRFYQRHAEFDRRASDRRKELHHKIEEKRRHRLEERQRGANKHEAGERRRQEQLREREARKEEQRRKKERAPGKGEAKGRQYDQQARDREAKQERQRQRELKRDRKEEKRQP